MESNNSKLMEVFTSENGFNDKPITNVFGRTH